MPASDFEWSFSQHFQVFRTKRKHDLVESAPDEQVEENVKKVCLKPPTECGDAMNMLPEINHNSLPPSADLHQRLMSGCGDIADVVEGHGQQDEFLTEASAPQQVLPQLSQPVHDQLSAQPQHLHNINTSMQPQAPGSERLHPSPSHSHQVSHMVMDLCDETYSHAELDSETQSMYSAMDSDGVPDLRQYGLAFCGDFCVGGDRSPTSGRVRCYCKPSWEGLMEMRPYVSDYY